MKKIVSFVLALILCLTTFTTLAGASDIKGSIKVETRKIEKIEGDLSLKVIYPYFSGFNAASELNSIIQNRNISSIGYIRSNEAVIKDIKAQQEKAGEPAGNMSAFLESYFDYNTSGSILSVVIHSSDYTGGAHGMSYMESYTVNTKTNEIYKTFGSLFDSKSNYNKVIQDKINKLIDKEKDMYFIDAKETVAAKKGNYQFYVDGNKLVIYFGLYELRPYAGGMPIFKIDAKDLKGLLKSDIYTQMINAKPLENVRFNGESLIPQPKTYTQEYNLMVPLQDIAKLLGYKATWSGGNGWEVAGGYVKNKVDSYSSSKSDGNVKLGLPPKAVGNIMYVPQTYFSMVLKEDVIYDGDALRIFKAESVNEGTFDQQIAEFESPDTAEKAVNMYAKAAQERKGAIQYALYSDKLKAEKRAGLEEMNWVTGVSSPWISGYEIYEIDNESKKTYSVIFNWATSAGKSSDTKTIVTVEKIPQQEYWQITEVTE